MRNTIFSGLKYLIAALFIYAGGYKIMDVALFKSQMYESPLLLKVLVPIIAVGLPIFEIILGLILIFSNKVKDALWLSLSLMILFTVYLLMLYFMYDRPPCACGGILSDMDYPEHIIFNIIFTIICGITLYCYEKITV